MSDGIALASLYGWPLAGLGALVAFVLAVWQGARLRRHNSRLLTALHNLPQGLCM